MRMAATVLRRGNGGHCSGANRTPPPPPHLSQHGPACGSGGTSAGTRGRLVWTSPRGRYHGTYVADISHPLPPQNMTMQSNSPAYTREPNSTWNYSYTNTLTPMLTHCAARTKLYTTFSWIGTAKMMVPKTAQKCRNKGSPCLDKPVLRGGGGGALDTNAARRYSSDLTGRFNREPSSRDRLVLDRDQGAELRKTGQWVKLANKGP